MQSKIKVGRTLWAIGIVWAASSIFSGAYAQTESVLPFVPGLNGANRRVITKMGAPNKPYIAGFGSYTEPVFFVPPGNTYHSTPQMYLSSSGDREVDAGITYAKKSNTSPAGWYLFIRATDSAGHKMWVSYGGIRANPNEVKIYPVGTLKQVHLTYEVLKNGGVQLKATGGGIGNALFHWNRNSGVAHGNGDVSPVYDQGPNQNITNAALAHMRIKRVVAIGQESLDGSDNFIIVDGSYMHNAIWSNGHVGIPLCISSGPMAGFFETKLNHFIPRYSPWKQSDVDLVSTGLIPSQPQQDISKDERGNWVIDFPGLAPLGPINASGNYRFYAPTNTGRYLNETTNIDLQRALRARGKPRQVQEVK